MGDGEDRELKGDAPAGEPAGEVLEAMPADGESLEATPIDEAPAEAGAEAPDVSKLRKELETVNGRYIRLAADFDNYRKRQARDRADTVAYANESLVIDILPVLDNLERALAAAAGACDGHKGAESVLKGVELTMRMFQGVLGRNGVERMKVVGEKFDPHRHEAVAQKAADDVEPETITDELEAGYTLNGRVIRSAKVRVACPSAPASGKEGTAEESKEETKDA